MREEATSAVREQADREPAATRSPLGAFARRALIAAAVAAVVVLVLALLWYGANVLLLVFAAILAAVFLRGLSDWVSGHTRLSPRWSLAAVVLALLVLF